MFFNLPTSEIEDRHSCLKYLTQGANMALFLVRVYSGVEGINSCDLVWAFFSPKSKGKTL